MPLTEIEDTLFRGRNIVHGVVDFTINTDSIILIVAPWPDLQPKTAANFGNAVVTSREVQAEDGNTELPWDIIGCDSYSLSDYRYRFVLHCDEIEIVFESHWPRIE